MWTSGICNVEQHSELRGPSLPLDPHCLLAHPGRFLPMVSAQMHAYYTVGNVTNTIPLRLARRHLLW